MTATITRAIHIAYNQIISAPGDQVSVAYLATWLQADGHDVSPAAIVTALQGKAGITITLDPAGRSNQLISIW